MKEDHCEAHVQPGRDEEIRRLTAEVGSLKNRFRSLIEKNSDGMIVVDLEGRVLFVNPAAVALIDRSSEDLIGRLFGFPIIGDDTVEIDIIRGDGTCALVEMWFTETSWEGSKSLLISLRDITESRKKEEERLRSQKLASLGELAGGIAHDFNNLLTALTGAISLARYHVIEEPTASSALAIAEKAAAQARDLAAQLLTFARGGSPEMTILSASKVVRDCADMALHGSSVACEIRLPEDLPLVEADPGQLAQVFTNLFINSMQAMPQGGRITVCGEEARMPDDNATGLPGGKYIRISVMDTGGGIAREHLSRIFDPYFSTKATGNGLGLAIAYSVTKRHGGQIVAESNYGAGSVFHVYLPASEATVTEAKARESRIIRGQGNILVMDDEGIVRLVVEMMLRELGYDVVSVVEGREAVALYRRRMSAGNPFDVVIMDLTVKGGLGGVEATQRILSMDPGAKVVVSSGYSDDPVMADYRRYGFAARISKPYVMENLSALVHDLLRGVDAPQPGPSASGHEGKTVDPLSEEANGRN